MRINENIFIKQGDCLEIIKNIPDNKIDMIITDPPYGINYKSNLQTGNRRSGKQTIVRENNYFQEIQNDSEIPLLWIKESYRVLKDNSAIYIFLHWSKWSILEKAVLEAGFNVKNMIVINKSNHGMGDLQGDYAPKHELLLFATKGRHVLNRIGGRKKNVFDLPVKYSGAKHYHPNEKPTSWITPFILESSNIGQIILDPFMGSASTGIACIENNRKFVGYELDENYFEIGKERLIQSLSQNNNYEN
jgi:site-specific DNA-methyltransferase (adenine-specific)